MNAKHENIGSDVFRSGVHGVNETVSIRLRCRCGWISKMCPDEWEARRELLKHMHGTTERTKSARHLER